MPCEILVNAVAHRKAIKGQLVAVKDQPCVWGKREGLPDYVIVTISNATADQVRSRTLRWTDRPDYEVSIPIGGRKQIVITMPAKLAAAFPNLELNPQRVRDYLVMRWGATITRHNRTEVVISVPQDTVLADLKADIMDRFERSVGKRYHFSHADVDTAIAAGGRVTITRAQALARIVDRAAP